MGPWADHRLVCVGESPIEDYPPHILNKGEKEELAEGLDADEYWDEEYGKLHAGSPVDLSSLVNSRYYKAGPGLPPSHLLDIFRRIALDQMRNMPMPMVRRILKLTSFNHFSGQPKMGSSGT